MRATAVALVFCAVCGANAVNTNKDHPIVKVINLLEGLKEKTMAEAQTEALAYSKFQFWCVTSTDKLRKAISQEKESIDELENKRDGLKKDQSSLDAEIEELTEQKKELNLDLDAKESQFKTTEKLYHKENDDLEATIKAIDKAIVKLSDAEGKTEAADRAKMGLTQSDVKTVLSLAGPKVTEEERHKLQASFLQWSSADDSKSRPKQLMPFTRRLKLRGWSTKILLYLPQTAPAQLIRPSSSQVVPALRTSPLTSVFWSACWAIGTAS